MRKIIHTFYDTEIPDYSYIDKLFVNRYSFQQNQPVEVVVLKKLRIILNHIYKVHIYLNCFSKQEIGYQLGSFHACSLRPIFDLLNVIITI